MGSAVKIEQGRQSLMRQCVSQSASERAAAIQAASAKMTPASREWIAGRVSVLLSHYWQPGDEAQVLADARLADWVAALGDFPRWAIEDGVRAWNRGEGGTRRPVPAAVAVLCRQAMQPLRDAIASGRRMEPEPVPGRTRVTAERAAAILAEVAAKRRVPA